MSTTRLSIRRWAGMLSRMSLLLKATSASDTTHLIDAINLANPSAVFTGRVGVVSAGTSANLGTVVRVTDNDRALTKVTFVPALTASTAIADEIELWNELDQGITPGDVHQLIDLGIESVADQNPVPVVDSEQDFLRTSPVLTLPASWRWFEGADWEDSRGIWHAIPENTHNFAVDVASRTVELVGPAAVNANNNVVRLRGSTRPAGLSTDSDPTNVDGQFLATWVAAQCLLNSSFPANDGPAMERRASKLFNDASTLANKARTRHTGMGIFLPV